MPIYILATKLLSEGIDIENRENMGKKWLEKIKTSCPEVSWKYHYAVLGPYDFISVYEAPDEKTAMKVSLITLSSGASKAESWTALEYTEFLELAKSIR